MADQTEIAFKEFDAPMAGFDTVDESSVLDETVQPWFAGFVTANGTHIPLFVPPAPWAP